MSFDTEEIEDIYRMQMNALVVMCGATDLAYRPWFFATALQQVREMA